MSDEDLREALRLERARADERDEARAEVERLRAIVERMRAEEEQGVRDYLALRDVADRALSERDRATVERDAALWRAERAEALLIEERASRLAERLQEGP